MKLLLTGAFKCTDEQIEYLKLLGHDIVFFGDEREKIDFDASDIEGVICNGLFVYNDIEQFRSLKYIQLTSSGFDRVPMDYIKQHGIEIHNARGVYSIPMAEFAVSGVLQLYKQSRYFYKNQKEHKWEKHCGLLELFGKNVCIVGCGSVGTECAKRFRAFGCKVIGVDLFPRKDEYYEIMYALSDLEKALSVADVVVLTLPLTEENHHIMNEERFALMKKDSVLVNIARGAVVNEPALLKALDEKLIGAVLDVFEEEPLDEHSPLWDMDNVILTPHNSFVGDGNFSRLYTLMLKKIKIYAK